jgi:hypothetical protein
MKKKGALRKDRIFHRQILGLRHTQMSGYAMENCENLTIVAEGYGKTRFVVKREFRRVNSDANSDAKVLKTFVGGKLVLRRKCSGAVSKIGTTVLFLASGVSVIIMTFVLFRAPQFWVRQKTCCS